MPAGREDDALSWNGDDDPTLDVGSTGDAGVGETVLPEGYTAVGKGSETVAGSHETPARRQPGGHADDTAGDDSPDDTAGASDDDDGGPATGNAELISLGVLGGFSLLFAVGWIIGGLRLQGTAEFLVAPLAYQVSLWLAVAAPLVWFATVLLLTRGARLWVRFAWLAGGIVLLVPWPFIMVGAIGQ